MKVVQHVDEPVAATTPSVFSIGDLFVTIVVHFSPDTYVLRQRYEGVPLFGETNF